MKKIEKKWWFLTLGLLLFLCCTYLVVTDRVVFLDDYIYDRLKNICGENWRSFFMFVTNLANPFILILITIILIIFLKPRKMGFFSLINLIITAGFNLILKSIFIRERPKDFLLFKETGYSYPSAHSMIGMCFYGFLVYLVWQTKWQKRYKIIISVILGIIIFLIGLSRIYFRVHYPSDVLAGFSISLVYLILFTHIVFRKWS